MKGSAFRSSKTMQIPEKFYKYSTCFIGTSLQEANMSLFPIGKDVQSLHGNYHFGDFQRVFFWNPFHQLKSHDAHHDLICQNMSSTNHANSGHHTTASMILAPGETPNLPKKRAIRGRLNWDASGVKLNWWLQTTNCRGNLPCLACSMPGSSSFGKKW